MVTKNSVMDELRREIASHSHMASVAARVHAPKSQAYHAGARDALKAALAFAADLGMNAAENTLGLGALAL